MTFNDDVDTIIELVKDATLKKFGQEIDLIVVYGSRARGTHRPSSDLEMFVVLESRKKTNVEWFFVYKDIPVDLWTKEWQELEKVSNKESAANGGFVLQAGTISTCNVIYYKDEKARHRFQQIRDKVKEFSKCPEINIEVVNKYFDNMYNFLGKIYFSKEKHDLIEARRGAWHIIISSIILLGMINNRYYLNNWGTNIHEAKEFAIFPKGLIDDARDLSTEDNFDNLLTTATRVVDNMRAILIEIFEKDLVDIDLAFLSTEVSSIEYLFKIRNAALQEDIIAASYAVFELQPLTAQDLWVHDKKWTKASRFLLHNELREKYDSYGFPDFTKAITSQDFGELIKLTDDYEKMFFKYIEEHDMKMNSFNNLEELKKYLNLE